MKYYGDANSTTARDRYQQETPYFWADDVSELTLDCSSLGLLKGWEDHCRAAVAHSMVAYGRRSAEEVPCHSNETSSRLMVKACFFPVLSGSTSYCSVLGRPAFQGLREHVRDNAC